MGLPGLPVQGLCTKHHVHPRTCVQTPSWGRSPNVPSPAVFSNSGMLWDPERVGARSTSRFSFRRPGEGLRICIPNKFQVMLLVLAPTLRTTAVLLCPKDSLSCHPESVQNAWFRALHCYFPPNPSVISPTLTTSARSRLRIQSTILAVARASAQITPCPSTLEITRPLASTKPPPNGLSDLPQFTRQCCSCSIV